MGRHRVDHEIPKLDPAFTRELQRILAERNAHCPRCKYNLSGVPGPRCPECGKNIAYYLRLADTNPARLPENRRKALLRHISRRVTYIAITAGSLVIIGWSLQNLAG
jgi:tRNA(Ile2) C34 agmatinyltransferase TiaS